MNVRVLQTFTDGATIYRPGIRALSAWALEDADELVRLGWIVLLENSDAEVSTP